MPRGPWMRVVGSLLHWEYAQGRADNSDRDSEAALRPAIPHMHCAVQLYHTATPAHDRANDDCTDGTLGLSCPTVLTHSHA